jgi:hypothetical protein
LIESEGEEKVVEAEGKWRGRGRGQSLAGFFSLVLALPGRLVPSSPVLRVH